MIDQTYLSSVITFAVVGIVTVIDYRRFRIPNVITYPFASAGLLFHYVNGGVPGLLTSLVGLIVGGMLLIAPFILHGFGGGDVKLLAATGAWLGASDLLWVFIVSGALLGLVSLILICRSATVRRAALFNLRLGMVQLRGIGNMLGGEDRVEEVVLREDRRHRAVPFGVVLSVGLALVFVWKWLVVGSN